MPRDYGYKPPAGAVKDHPCEKCGHLMEIKLSYQKLWFYGCSRWPDCHFTFDADLTTGAPVVHTRRGIPLRGPATAPGREHTLWDALRKSEFDPKAGKALEQSKRESAAQRKRALKDLDRDPVRARVQAAAPKTQDEWVELIIAERQRAIDEYQQDEAARFRQEQEIGRQRRAQAQAQAKLDRGFVRE
jgi:ssDNA-binding Zn-finger/Zn-ribbon topoisomerase 1